VEKTSKLEQKLVYKRVFKFYVIPLISVVGFIGIIVFLVIPKVSEIFKDLDNISTLSASAESKNNEIKTLDTLNQNSNLTLAQLNIIDQTAPTGSTEVVTFRDKITDLINNNSLTIVTQRLSESDINSNSQNINHLGLSLLEIPFFFEINGTYQNTLAFIEDLSSIDDFIIVREMDLTGSSVNNIQVTTLRLRIDKYQFSIADESLLKAQYLEVPVDSKINDVVLKYIESKIL